MNRILIRSLYSTSSLQLKRDPYKGEFSRLVGNGLGGFSKVYVFSKQKSSFPYGPTGQDSKLKIDSMI